MGKFKKKLFGYLGSARWYDSALFFIRLFIGVMMLTHGIAKLQNYNALSAAFPDPIGWGSSISFFLITLVEVGGSLFLIAGFLVRPVAIVMAAAMFTATFLTYSGGIAAHELSFIYLGVYIMLAISGGGKYALDRMVFKKK
jgi:Predicted membrane protein